LDLESIAALADSVKEFEGAVVAVSHDQFFVGEIANENDFWLVNNGSVKNIESFKKYRDTQIKKLNASTPAPTPAAAGKPAAKTPSVGGKSAAPPGKAAAKTGLGGGKPSAGGKK
jgi:hypothetical protein